MSSDRQAISATRGNHLSEESMPKNCNRHPAIVRCGNCRHFSVRQAGHELAALGYGRCALAHERGRFLSARYPRQCTGFACAAPKTI